VGEIAVQPPPGGAAGPVVPAGARVYVVDGTESVVTIKVHRAGPFAKLGHNHVVTASHLTGSVWRGSDPAGSGFEIHVPVASLVVDDPAARAAAGSGFEADVPQSARYGTYQNMLRPEVLDGAEFPEVVVRAASLDGTWNDPVANADLTIRGATRRIEVPVSVRESEGTLKTSGSFRILQSDFGITPFSVAGGAIQVADELELAFEIVAVPPGIR
jgi:polyisoprenoid-binding protein YceI